MSGFNIITVIAIILFARLGMRLISRYLQDKNQNDQDRPSDPQE